MGRARMAAGRAEGPRARRRTGTGLLLGMLVAGLLFLAPAPRALGQGESADVPLYTFVKALREAEQNSPSLRLARIALEEARLDYRAAQADMLRNPSVVARQRTESAWLTAQRNYELARQDLTMAVAQAYYDVLRAQMDLDLAVRNLAQAEAQLESTRARYEVGMVSEVDLMAAESQVASAKVELNRAQANEATARMRFNRVLGRDLEAPFELVDAFAYEDVDVSLEEALAHALETRIELQRARDELALRELELQVSDPRYTPALTIERLQVAVEEARVALANQEADIVLEVRANYQTLVEARDRIPIRESNVERARESLRIAEERFEAGVITAIDLMDAQRDAFEAETDLIEAVFDYNVALARFFRGAGYPLDQVLFAPREETLAEPAR